jgi:xanthine dehydrogenase YagS FAD-binding subunit
MKSFNHVNAKTVNDAVRLLENYNGRARLNAGGTDLLGILKDKILPDYPETIINIKTIPDLDYISEDADRLRIGALARLENIAQSSVVKSKYKLLAEAAAAVATPQIRRMGTIGGNLCQDVRCWYYRYPHHLGGRMICRRKGKGPCFAIKGDNRYNAILGAKSCFAVCPSDTAVSLSALKAEIKIVGADGERTLPIADFYRPLGNILKKDELITEIAVSRPSEGSRQEFLKFTQRESVDFSIVSVASVITLKDGICVDASITMGGVAPMPFRAVGAEQAIIGMPVNERNAEAASEASVINAIPLSRNAYKVEIIKTLVKRAIMKGFLSEKEVS